MSQSKAWSGASVSALSSGVSQMARLSNSQNFRSMQKPGLPSRSPLDPPPWLRWSLLALALAFVTIFLIAPLSTVLFHALKPGLPAFWAAISAPDSVEALRLTLLVLALVLPLNLAFALAAAWLLSRHRFLGRALLSTLIDLPLSVSPVISGLLVVLIFGRSGWLGLWLESTAFRVLFALPGIVLATLFVTLPLIARELIAHLQATGSAQEEAALMLGAGGWQTFWHVTLPGARWALIYGSVLCAARAMGEFGAVSVVSGHIRGETVTLPLQIEILYEEYAFGGAFALSALLLVLALIAVALRHLLLEGGAGKRSLNRTPGVVVPKKPLNSQKAPLQGAGGAP